MFHILVVEDDQALNKLICRVLNKNGYETASATDGEEALALLDQMYIDLIITDLMMPNMDGHQAAKTIRAMEKERPDASSIPIIALSANAFAEDVKASVDSGMNGHISKPFDMEEVTATIAKYVKP